MSDASAAHREVVRLTDLIGERVTDGAGAPAGRVVDVVAAVHGEHPLVSALMVRPHRRAPAVRTDRTLFDGLGLGALRLAGPLPGGEEERHDEVLLRRDVLDVQIVDAAHRRMARVGDVDLARTGEGLRVVAVDVGWRAILRRLGLRRLARRASRDAIDWETLHVASGRAHALQLRSSSAAVHRLDADELATLVARLPAASAGDVLHSVEPGRAAAALTALHPALSADLLAALPPEHAQRLAGAMGRRPAAEPAAGERPPRRYWNVLRGHGGGRR